MRDLKRPYLGRHRAEMERTTSHTRLEPGRLYLWKNSKSWVLLKYVDTLNVAGIYSFKILASKDEVGTFKALVHGIPLLTLDGTNVGYCHLSATDLFDLREVKKRDLPLYINGHLTTAFEKELKEITPL